jgi:ATP/maltotriose-dependent transcriptional regulator MalT
MAMAHGNLTMVALRLADIEVASEHAAQCLRLEREQGNTRGIMLGLLCLGEIELSRGDLPAAEVHLDEARTLSRSAGDVFGEAMALHQLGLVAARSGDRGTARRRTAAALVLRRDADDRGDLAESLETLADLLGADGATPRLAARLVGAAQTLRARFHLPAGPAGTVERLGGLLAPEALELELETGRYASLDAIVDEAVDAVEEWPTK